MTQIACLSGTLVGFDFEFVQAQSKYFASSGAHNAAAKVLESGETTVLLSCALLFVSLTSLILDVAFLRMKCHTESRVGRPFCFAVGQTTLGFFSIIQALFIFFLVSATSDSESHAPPIQSLRTEDAKNSAKALLNIGFIRVCAHFF